MSALEISNLSDLDQQHMDVAIVGAGINGASAAQHLSAAGYRVLVVDQGDFANGATSRSSRLLHCGLRHLASGSGFWKTLMRPDRIAMSMGTVRADMLARDEIVRSISNRVKPINFCLPIYSDDQYAPWQLDAAFAALRMTSPTGVPLDYRRYSAKQFDQVPIHGWLRDPGKLRSVAVFREYIFDWPERIALDALFDARRMGALVRNYTRVDGLTRRDSGRGWQLALSSVGPDENDGGEIASVTADLVLNLAGAWVDEVIQGAGSNSAPKCTGIKGVHIALRLPEEFADWGVFTYNSLGEPLYCLPFRGIHYIGLTRTPIDGDIAEICASDQEIDWMIAETNRCLPKLSVTREDILFSWAGVNPLTHDPKEPLGSREIKIHDLESSGLPDMMALTGGPIMTYRRVARSLVEKVSRRLSANGEPQDLLYGSGTVMLGGDELSEVEVRRSAREELPSGLTDLMTRRLGLGWEPDQGMGQVKRVAGLAAAELGWSADRVEVEVKQYRAYLRAARRRPKG